MIHPAANYISTSYISNCCFEYISRLKSSLSSLPNQSLRPQPTVENLTKTSQYTVIAIIAHHDCALNSTEAEFNAAFFMNTWAIGNLELGSSNITVI